MAAGCSDDSDNPAPTPTSGTLSGTADDGTKPLDEYIENTIPPTGGVDSVFLISNQGG